jgi:ribonuclease D
MMKAHPNVETLHSVVSIYHMASSDLEALQNHYFCLQQMNPTNFSAKLIIVIKSCCSYSLLRLQSKSIITNFKLSRPKKATTTKSLIGIGTH